MANPDYVLKTG